MADFAEAFTAAIAKRSNLKKTASEAQSAWYDEYFYISEVEFSVPTELKVKFDEFCVLVQAAFTTYLSAANKANDEKDIQQAFNILLLHISKLFPEKFKAQYCSQPSRDIKTFISDFVDPTDNIQKNCIVTGQPDCTIVSHEIGCFTCELKTPKQPFLKQDETVSSLFKSACTQIMLYLKAEVEIFNKKYSVVPDVLYGLLTNGNEWSIIMAFSKIEKDGDITFSWKRTVPILVQPSADDQLIPLQLLFMMYHNATSIFELVDEIFVSPLASAFKVSFNLGTQNDAGDDEDGAGHEESAARSSGGDDGGVAPGAGTASDNTTNRGGKSFGGVGSRQRSSGHENENIACLHSNVLRERDMNQLYGHLPPILRKFIHTSLTTKPIVTFSAAELFE